MASNAESVSIWWRHHVYARKRSKLVIPRTIQAGNFLCTLWYRIICHCMVIKAEHKTCLKTYVLFIATSWPLIITSVFNIMSLHCCCYSFTLLTLDVKSTPNCRLRLNCDFNTLEPWREWSVGHYQIVFWCENITPWCYSSLIKLTICFFLANGDEVGAPEISVRYLTKIPRT